MDDNKDGHGGPRAALPGTVEVAPGVALSGTVEVAPGGTTIAGPDADAGATFEVTSNRIREDATGRGGREGAFVPVAHEVQDQVVQSDPISPEEKERDAAERARRRRRRWCITFLSVLLVVSVVLIALGVTGQFSKTATIKPVVTEAKIKLGPPPCPRDRHCHGFYECWVQMSCDLTDSGTVSNMRKVASSIDVHGVSEFGRIISLSGHGRRLALALNSPSGWNGAISLYDAIWNDEKINTTNITSNVTTLRGPPTKWSPSPLPNVGNGILDAVLSGDGKVLAVIQEQGMPVQVFEDDPGCWDQEGLIMEEGTVTSMDLSEDGSVLVLGQPSEERAEIVRCIGGKIERWSLRDPEVQSGNSIGSSSMNGSGFGKAVAVSTDGKVIAIGAPGYIEPSGDTIGNICVFHLRLLSGVESWDLFGGGCITGGPAMDGFGSDIAISSDGAVIAGTSYNNNGQVGPAGIFAHDEATGWIQVGGYIGGNVTNAFPRSIALSSSGNRVAVSENNGYTGHVKVYDLADDTWQRVGGDITIPIFSNFTLNSLYGGISFSMSSDGTTLAVAGGKANATDGSSVVKVFEMAWRQLGPDHRGTEVGDEYGSSVRLSANAGSIGVASPKNGVAGEASGVVQVYNILKGYTLKQIGQIIRGLPGDEVRGYLSRNGQRLAVGARFNGGPNSTIGKAGEVRVFQLDKGTGMWVRLGAPLYGTDPKDRLGNAVDLNYDGSILAASMPLRNATGVVRVFNYTTNMKWEQIGQDIYGAAPKDRFGWDVALSDTGTTLVVGARWHSDVEKGYQIGHVQVYRFNGDNWTQVGQDLDGLAEGNHFGVFVTISPDGSTIACGAVSDQEKGPNDGQIRVFTYHGDQGEWVQVGDGISFPCPGNAASRVSLSSDARRLAVGYGEANDNAGCAAIYDLLGNKWRMNGEVILPRYKRQNFGWSVSLSDDGTTVAIGGSARFTDIEKPGVVRLFEVRGRQEDFKEGSSFE